MNVSRSYVLVGTPFSTLCVESDGTQSVQIFVITQNVVTSNSLIISVVMRKRYVCKFCLKQEKLSQTQ